MKAGLLNALLTLLAATPTVLAAPTPLLPDKPGLRSLLPIKSKAELTRYLHDTPAGTSPLDKLSPWARKRFLAQVEFGPRGATTINFGEPQAELTRPQIIQLFALFGTEQEKLAKSLDIGLTGTERSRIEHERMADAKARDCALERCPESEIERRYDELILKEPALSMPVAKRLALDRERYNHLFADDQSPERLRSTSSPDLRLLIRASEYVLAMPVAPSAIHIAQLQMDLTEMQRRGMTDDKGYTTLYESMLSNRQFIQAATLLRKHPELGESAMPTMHNQAASLSRGSPTALTIDKQGHSMTRKAFDVAQPLSIVALSGAGCHFCEKAAHAVEKDAQLRSLFANHAIWLATQGANFEYAKTWNHLFPDQPMHIAWQNSEWSMLADDAWGALPAFYVFRDGHLVKKFLGWDGVKKFKRSLRGAGALR